jgi:K+-transporting ATPase ATPase A chain
MTTDSAGVAFVASLALALRVTYRPFGDYMACACVFTSSHHTRAERVVYRRGGIDPDAEQTWPAYMRSVFAFAAVGVLPQWNGIQFGRAN